ncbi:hypothetical protein GT037_008436 [Alternaria burnsii]|uniref:Uncharacterized protein n=1 Tax=Alternaria burnsii TaxID=1187904 RepID=A0A8H7B3C4_9PLEO|nr:uncharacterized protein GT037_008436 [Alternaria burnsii]KAF7673821.1 hypothetical protein GT037_008436 [Alternaria burnsii]
MCFASILNSGEYPADPASKRRLYIYRALLTLSSSSYRSRVQRYPCPLTRYYPRLVFSHQKYSIGMGTRRRMDLTSLVESVVRFVARPFRERRPSCGTCGCRCIRLRQHVVSRTAVCRAKAKQPWRRVPRHASVKFAFAEL